MNVTLKNPRTSEIKQIKIGWSWVLFFFAGLWGIPLFLRRLYVWGGIFLFLGIVGMCQSWIAYLVAEDEATTAVMGIGTLGFSLAYVGLNIFIAAKGNELTAKNYLECGWVFAMPNSMETVEAMRRWNIQGINTPVPTSEGLGDPCFAGTAICRPPGDFSKAAMAVIAVFVIVAISGKFLSSSRTEPHPSAHKSYRIDPRLIHPQSDQLIQDIRAGTATIPAGYHIERDEASSDGQPEGKAVLVRRPTEVEQAEHCLENLQTSLRGGPEPAMMATILSKWLKGDTSFNRYPSQDMDDMYEMGVIGNTMKDIQINNEYTRKVDGEVVFFYDFQVEVTNAYGPVRKAISCSFVKRGKRWYLYSVDGKRLEGF